MNMVRSSSYTSLESASEQQPTSSLRRQQSAPNSQNTTPLKSVNNSALNSPLRATADSRVRAIIDYWYSHTCFKRPLLLPASLLEFISLVNLSFYFFHYFLQNGVNDEESEEEDEEEESEEDDDDEDDDDDEYTETETARTETERTETARSTARTDKATGQSQKTVIRPPSSLIKKVSQ